MSWVIVHYYRDSGGKGFFVLNTTGNSVSWGYNSATNLTFATRAEAEAAAAAENAKDACEGLPPPKWEVREA